MQNLAEAIRAQHISWKLGDLIQRRMGLSYP